MGARRPLNERPRRGGVKCEFCGRYLLSSGALKTHQNILHPHALKEKMKRAASSGQAAKVQKPEPRKVVIKKAIPKPLPKEPKEIAEEMPVEESSPKVAKAKPRVATPKPIVKTDPVQPKVQVPTKLQGSPKPPAKVYAPATKVRQTEYRCPKCEKAFPVRFVAMKHIEKHHCLNNFDEEVTPDSPDIIQPILVELCQRCNIKFPAPHDCPLQLKQPSIWYECSECEQRFKNTVLFTKHIEEEHADLIQKMYFPLEEEFLTWKKQMEAQTECSYVIMQKVSTKQIYYCSEFMESGIDGHPQFCPSTIISNTSSTNGLNIFFYPNHYGHKHKKYNAHKFSHSLSNSSEQNKLPGDTTDGDLYVQFKTAMDSIVFDSAKINAATLKILLDKATEMQSIINDYKRDNDDIIDTSSALSSASINTISLDSIQEEEDKEMNKPLKGRKRNITEDGPSANKKKTSVKKPNTFSLADDRDSDKILKELDGPNKVTPRKSLKSPSFNDSYKEFIDKTISSKNRPVVVGKKKNVKLVKTKIGIFKPSSSPKKEERRSSVGKAKDLEYEVREQKNDCNILVLKIW